MVITVTLPEDLVSYVDQRVLEGTYANRSDAISTALHIWRTGEEVLGYEKAFAELDSAWDFVAGDGIGG